MNNNKILFIHPNYYSGGAQVMINIFNQLKDNSDFSCYMMFVGKSNYIQNLLNPSREIIYYKYDLLNPIFLVKLTNYILKHKINIIYTHSPATHLLLSFMNIFLRKKLVLHIHGDFDTNYIKVIFRKMLFNLSASKIIVVSKDLRNSLINIYNIKHDKIIVVHNGVKDLSKEPIDYFLKNKLIQKYNLNDKFVLLFIGRLVKIKNLDLLINVSSKLDDDIVFLIVGDGILKNELNLKINNMNVPKKVFLLGFLENDKINTILSISDVFILPSFHEGISISALEAISMSKPVLLSNVGGNPEILINNEDLLFNINNEAEIIKKINNLKDEYYYSEKATQLYRVFLENFNIENNANNIEQIFNKM
ncbi:MAG: glycosyltransferase family 4 protein [Candidatus Cloacimonetes bacterium]|nr:glycosyltransferase family 4 protein [Candidatus Cloacimonadota bacterium]